MRKLLLGLLGLILSVPAMAADTMCNLYNKETGALRGYPTGSYTWNSNSSSPERTIMVKLTEGAKYTVVRVAGSGTPAFRIQASQTETLTNGQQLVNVSSSSSDKLTFTVPTGAPYVLFYVYNTSNPTITIQQAIDGFMVVEGSTAPSEYIPYDASCFNTCPNGGVLQTYTTATGTVVQNGTPTPDNPITPTFYTQGNMVLRKVGNYADSYDATTGKITRRVAVVVFDGTESWAARTPGWEHTLQGAKTGSDGLMLSHFGFRSVGWVDVPVHYAMRSGTTFRINYPEATTAAELKSWLAAQYNAGTPVTVWYPLATPVEEDWTGTSYCQSPIKIATTAYNSARFSPVVTELNDTIATIRSVVTNTINQTKAIADLQATKQTRPDETCPAGKKCLLVEDNDGTPHWFEIIENAD